MPLHVHLHGVVLTLWFLLPVVQTQLVARHRTDLHRKLGWAGAVLALVLIVTGVITIMRSVPRFLAAPNGPRGDALYNIVAGDLVVILLVFPVLFGAALWKGVLWKKDALEFHRRWMLLSYLALMGPVLARFILVWGLPPALVVPVLFAFLVALVVYDVRRLRRVHWATITGILFLIAGQAVVFVATSLPATHAFVDALAQ
jgi:hypothetical protein